MDYSNFDEVAKAIMDYDCNLGTIFYNLPTYIGNAFGKLKESKYSDAKNKLNELAMKAALETLLIFKRNEKDLQDEKVYELYAKYASIPEENKEWEAVAYETYKDEEDEFVDMETEIEDLRNYIECNYAVVR